MKRLLTLAVVITAASQAEAINTQGGIRTAASIRSYCHKNGLNYQASPQGGYCVKAGLLGSSRNLGPNGQQQLFGPGGVQRQQNVGGNPATWAPKKLGPNGQQQLFGPGGVQRQQNVGGNPATWAPKMTGNKGGSF